MKNFIISSESASDLTNTLIKNYELEIMPMKYFINGKEFSSENSENRSQDIIIEAMKNGATTTTTQPNEFEIECYLKNLLKKKKDILHLSFSSAMSGTCQNFKNVAEKLNKNNSNKIYVVDTLCQSSGLGLLLSILCEKVEKDNLSFNQAIEFVEKNKLSINHVFMVDTLTYLAKGGRISNKQAILGNIIKIKPILYLDETGKICLAQKTLGRKKALSLIVNKFIQTYNSSSEIVYIGHSECLEDATKVKTELMEKFPNLRVQIIPFGPIILSHCGPKTLALFYTSNTRKY